MNDTLQPTTPLPYSCPRSELAAAIRRRAQPRSLDATLTDDTELRYAGLQYARCWLRGADAEEIASVLEDGIQSPFIQGFLTEVFICLRLRDSGQPPPGVPPGS